MPDGVHEVEGKKTREVNKKKRKSKENDWLTP